MAWDNYQNEGKMSEFNTAALKMMRLDKIESLLNQINGNLLAWNQEYGVWNFQLKFSLCDALYQEIESKLKPEERGDAEKLRNAIQIAMEEDSIYKLKKNKVYPYKQREELNKPIWKVIKKWLFIYETKVRKLLDDHGMDTKYEDESALF